jgi:tetratricopeptide (TPR) repeat protein
MAERFRPVLKARRKAVSDLDRIRHENTSLKEQNRQLARRLKQAEQDLVSSTRFGIILDLRNGIGAIVRDSHELRLTPQWIEYFALLYLHARDPVARHRFVTASELHTVGHWRPKQEDAVGKEVSRFLNTKIKPNSFAAVVNFEPGQKTNRWRLSSDTSLVGGQSRTELAEELRARGWRQSGIQSTLALSDFVRWASDASQALMLLQSGEVLDAQQKAQALLRKTTDPILERTTRMLAIRATQRAGESTDKYDVDLGDFHLVQSWGVGAVARAFHSRAVALMSYWAQPPKYDDEIAHMRSLLADAEAAGDVGAIAIMYGTLAVLHRRSGNYPEAEQCLRRAIPMLIANGDIMNLQGALFNMGHVIERRLRKEGIYSYQNALDMLQQDMDLRDRFNLGRDSAQCEILMALIWAERDAKSPKADTLLEKAKSILAQNDSAYDYACWHRACGKLLYRRAEVDGNLGDAGIRKKIIQCLTRAVRWFEKADRPVEREDTEKKLQMFRVKGKIW